MFWPGTQQTFSSALGVPLPSRPLGLEFYSSFISPKTCTHGVLCGNNSPRNHPPHPSHGISPSRYPTRPLSSQVTTPEILELCSTLDTAPPLLQLTVRWCTGDLSGGTRGEVDGVVVKTTREEEKVEGEKGQVVVAAIS